MVGLKGCLFTNQRPVKSDDYVKLRTMVDAMWLVGGILGEEVGLGVGCWVKGMGH